MTRRTVNADRRQRVYGWLKNSLNRLFPPVCQVCGAAGVAGRDLCAACHDDLPWLRSGCPRCALPAADSLLCAHCLRRPPPFQRVLAAFRYAAPIDSLVQAFKFRDDLPNGRLLADLLAESVMRETVLPQLLLPVPLHPRRLRQRGFNQAWELARPLGRRFGIAADPSLLVRLRHTEAQHDLLARQRHGNVRGAFALSRPLAARHVAVVDDVMTTGHTAAELARVLRRAGAERVDVWVVARTPRPARAGPAP